MSYFPTDIPFMSDEELIENGLKKPYKKPEIIDSKDLVPVVRCKDCEFYIGKRRRCGLKNIRMSEDDFCSYGERRED